MATVTFDKLAYTQALRAGGFTDQQAEASAHALDNALRDSVATKGDIDRLERKIESVQTDLEHRIESVQTSLEHRIDTVQTGLERRIDTVRMDLEYKTDTVQTGLEHKIDALRAELKQEIATQKLDLLKWLVPLLIGQAALIVALGKLL